MATSHPKTVDASSSTIEAGRGGGGVRVERMEWRGWSEGGEDGERRGWREERMERGEDGERRVWREERPEGGVRGEAGGRGGARYLRKSIPSVSLFMCS